MTHVILDQKKKEGFCPFISLWSVKSKLNDSITLISYSNENLWLFKRMSLFSECILNTFRQMQQSNMFVTYYS